jgi:hypothetical protein
VNRIFDHLKLEDQGDWFNFDQFVVLLWEAIQRVRAPESPQVTRVPRSPSKSAKRLSLEESSDANPTETQNSPEKDVKKEVPVIISSKVRRSPKINF